MSDFLFRMQQAQNESKANQQGLGDLAPASIDSIVNQISTDLENRIVKQASGQGMVHTQSEGNFISHIYEYRFYHTQIAVVFQQKACSAIYHYGGGESDWDYERYYVGVRDLQEAKQIAIAITRRLYANKMQTIKPIKNKTGSSYHRPNWEFYTVDEAVRAIQNSSSLRLDGFSTSVYNIVSKTTKR